MEIGGPDRQKESNVMPSDVYPPDEEGKSLRGPSRTGVMMHLAGAGLGSLLLLVGLGLGLSRNMWDTLALVPVILGGALLAGWLTVSYGFLMGVVRNRRVMVGTNAVFMALLGTVLLVMVNFISNRHYYKWDMTSAGRYTLSSKTVNLLEELDQDVTVITVSLERARADHEVTVEYLKELLELYQAESAHISSLHVKPDTNPAAAPMLVEKYGISLIAASDLDSLFVISGDRRKVIRLNDVIKWEPDPNNPGRTVPKTFRGEQLLTSAILEVMEESKYKVYMLSGHGERSIADGANPGLLRLASILRRENCDVETLQRVPPSGVPDDCDVLVIIGPRTILADDEVQGIALYLQEKGRLLVAQEPQAESGLEAVLEEWRIEFGGGAVISMDARTTIKDPVTFVAGGFQKHEISTPLMKFGALFSLARPVNVLERGAGKAQAVSILTSSPGTFVETDLREFFRSNRFQQNPETEPLGEVSLVVAVDENRPVQADGVAAAPGTRIVAFGDVDALTNASLGGVYSNADLARNSINWLLERELLIAIEQRPEAANFLVVNAAANMAVLFLLVFGVPLLVLLTAGVVWAARSYGSRVS